MLWQTRPVRRQAAGRHPFSACPTPARSIIPRLFVLPLAMAMFFFAPAAPLPGADDAEVARKRLEEVQQKIEEHEEKLKEVRKFEDSLLGELERTERLLASVEKELGARKRELDETKRRIREVRAEMAELEKKIEKRRAWMRRKLRAVHKYGNYGDAVILLVSSENIAELIRRYAYLKQLAGYEHQVVEEFKADLAALAERREELDSLAATRSRKLREIETSQAALERKQEEKRRLLASIRQKRETYRKVLAEMQDVSKRLKKIIEQAQKSSGGFTGKGFRQVKGRLSAPVSGRVALPYGRHKDPRYDTTVFRNGIYYVTKRGALVTSVHSGKVVFADWFKGYGQLVILDHGEGYHSLYGNLSEIFLGAGDIIEKEAKIGRAGDTVLLDSPSLYFEIRYKGRALDPEQWIR